MTYGEYLAFIEDGGYKRPELWLSLGWDTVRTQDWQAPLYWQHCDGRWHNFTLHGMVEIEPNTPVCHISFFEADAYARWGFEQIEPYYDTAPEGTIFMRRLITQ